jgi:hypothetical protein
MKALIYQPTKNAMQSGKQGNNNFWVIEYEKNAKEDGFYNDPIMGWVASNNTKKQVRLKFSTKEKAVDYAHKNSLEFEISEPKQKKIILRSYASNFTNPI